MVEDYLVQMFLLVLRLLFILVFASILSLLPLFLLLQLFGSLLLGQLLDELLKPTDPLHLLHRHLEVCSQIHIIAQSQYAFII